MAARAERPERALRRPQILAELPKLLVGHQVDVNAAADGEALGQIASFMEGTAKSMQGLTELVAQLLMAAGRSQMPVRRPQDLADYLRMSSAYEQ